MKEEFWTDLNKDWEGLARELPGDLDETAQRELQSMAGLTAQEPYSPAVAYGMNSLNDPEGSWTGIPADPNAILTQDADDL